MKYSIDSVCPINTKIVPNGGIDIDWSGPIGWGQLTIYWGEDGKLHADTEYLGKEFVQEIFKLLPNFIVIDE